MKTKLAILMLVLFAFVPGSVMAQTYTSEPSKTGDDDRGDDGYDAPRGQADDGPAMGGIIVGVLFVAILALLFAGYMHYRR